VALVPTAMMAKRTWKNFTMTKRLTGGAV